MHIMEGYLPVGHAVAWTVAAAPFVVHSVRMVDRLVKERPQAKLLLGVCGGFAFVLSALKLPSVTGSSSHPTGVGLGAILFGPWIMTLLGTVVLLFQALLMAHGGLTTLGANAFAMAIVGPWVSYGVYRLAQRLRSPLSAAVFLAAALGGLATYVTTSLQLALAFPDPVTGVMGSLVEFLSLFLFTQVPLAISEGLLTVLVVNLLRTQSRPELEELSILAKGVNP